MQKARLALWAAIPLLLVTSAMAQTTAPNDNPPPQPGMHHWMMQDPVAWHKEMCGNRYARLAGRLGFLEAKLSLTDAQRPLWNTWRQAWMDDASKMKDACLADTPPQPDKPPTVVELDARREKMLSAELAGLQARRPALEALYAALTPEQKTTFDRLADRGRPDRHFGMIMEQHDR